MLTGIEIKTKIDNNNKEIERMLTPNIFTLNNTVATLLKENEQLQNMCEHNFDKEGFCIYCYKMKEE